MESTHLSILHTVARKLSSSVHLEQILQIILAQVAELLGLETGWIFLLDGRDTFYLAASQNLPPGLAADPPRTMTGWCWCLDMFRHDKLHSGENVSIVACSRLNGLSGEAQTGGLRFHASIPLQAGGQKLGVLNAASRQKQALSQEELHTLYTIGDLLSLAIQRTRYYEEHLSHSALSERYRMARDLHDSLGQGLAALIMRLELLDALIDKQVSAGELRQQVSKSIELARTTLREARGTLQQLRSDAAVPDLAERVQEMVSQMLPQVRARIDIAAWQPSPALAQSLQRMLQELLTNIHKHARAKQVSVQLDCEGDGVRLSVSDDGSGFDPEQIRQGHFGLIGLRERVHLLQGQIEIETGPGRGTRIAIFLPGETP